MDVTKFLTIFWHTLSLLSRFRLLVVSSLKPWPPPLSYYVIYGRTLINLIPIDRRNAPLRNLRLNLFYRIDMWRRPKWLFRGRLTWKQSYRRNLDLKKTALVLISLLACYVISRFVCKITSIEEMDHQRKNLRQVKTFIGRNLFYRIASYCWFETRKIWT